MTGAAAARGEERADEVLGVVNDVPATRMSSRSAWEDGTPLRARVAPEQVTGWVVQESTDLDADPTDLLTASGTGPAEPAAHAAATDIVGKASRRTPLSAETRHRALVALALVVGAGVVAGALVTVGTLVLPVLAALALLAGLISRRGGAR